MAIARINALPLYRAEINGDGEGIEAIALVDFPAVMSDFIKFAEQKPEPRQLYAVSDEEKRLVMGVVMRADFPIYRIGKDDYEYYIYYSPEVIRQMAQKYLADGRSNEVNLMHQEDAFVEGVEMVQWYIKDSAAGIAPEGFAEISDGSLFAEFHVTNDDVWASIKAGEFRGFSLEGYFSVEPETSQEKADAMAVYNKGKFSKLFKNLTMSKLNKIKAALAAILAQYGSVATDKGVISWDGEEDLKAGDKVFTETEGGERVAAGDGEYVTEDGKTIVVVDGSVSEIRDPEAEVEGACGDGEEQKNGDPEGGEGGEVANPEGEGGEDVRKAVEGLRKEVDEIYDILDKVLDKMGTTRDEIESLRSQNTELKAQVEKLGGAPAAESAHDAFEKQNAEPQSGSERAARIAGARF